MSSNRDELRSLIAQAQAGDVRAFESLVVAYHGKVRRFARAFAHSEADADDLAQEALVKVYKSLRSYRFQSAFSTWLFTVVRNVVIDSGRTRAGRERSIEAPLGESHERMPSEADLPDQALAHAEEQRRVWEALREVPPEFRAALVLFDLEGHSYEEVAAIEGVAIGTVKSRLSRGRAHLRELLSRADRGTGTSMSAIPSNGRRGAR